MLLLTLTPHSSFFIYMYVIQSFQPIALVNKLAGNLCLILVVISALLAKGRVELNSVYYFPNNYSHPRVVVMRTQLGLDNLV